MVNKPCKYSTWLMSVALSVGFCQSAGADSQKAEAAWALSESAGDIVLGRDLQLGGLEQLDGVTDGTGDAEPVSLQRWRQAAFELEKAATVDLQWPKTRELKAAARWHTSDEPNWKRVPLGLLHVRYEQDSADAPSQQRTAFALSALQEQVYHGESFELVLDEGAYLRHAVDAAAELWLDADDGLGFRPLQIGEPMLVSYSSAGEKTLRLEARLPDGQVLQSSSALEVQLGTPDPDETWNVVASQSYEGIAGSGSAYVYLAEGHTSLTNPVVVVEGFDIGNDMGWPELYDMLNDENLLEDLRAAGYDAVVLDFTDAVDPIQRNAFVVTELLQMVNAAIPPGQTSVMVGASMGGLVSRYALLWLEDQAIEHRVRKLISFDSPHKGANIPLGLQAWVEFFSSQAEEAEFLLEQLRSPAAKQMLLYHLDSQVGTTANADPLMAVLNAEFAGLGGWPLDAQLVSVVNGSGAMTGQGYAPGAQIIEWNYNAFPIAIDGDVWALPNGGSKQIFNGRIAIFLVGTTTGSLTVSGTLPWDNAPGGSRSSMQQAADVPAPYGDIQALHSSHNFIPTISALALDSNDPFYDIAGDADLLEHTPFQTVYFPAENQEHIDITPQNKLWFMAEVMAATEELIFADGFEQP